MVGSGELDVGDGGGVPGGVLGGADEGGELAQAGLVDLALLLALP